MSAAVLRNLVGGAFVDAREGGLIDVVDPSTEGALVGRVPAMTADDLPAVFEAARAGARTWKAVDPLARGRVLLDAAALIRRDAGELVDTIVREMGKTRAEATGEVGKAAEFFEYYGGLARGPVGSLVPDARTGTFAAVLHEPVGVVVLITPWNDPLLTPARKLAPALLSGNAVVLKPATETPLIALRLAALLHEAGLPAGVLGTVTGRGADIGDALATDAAIAAISFTGSTEVGRRLQRTVAGSGVRLQTEMGGKNAAVVLDDADLDIAVAAIGAGAFAQAGQRCTATSRLIVQRGVADELRSRLAAAVDAIAVGPGADDATTMGPVVSHRARDEIRSAVERALEEGADVVARGSIAAVESSGGAYVAPALLQVAPDSSIWRDEVFGPVLAMLVVDTVEEAIDAVNASAYGLSSAVFTRDLGNAFAFVHGVDTGQVSVNQPTSGWDVHHPFGGFKDSGSPFKEQGTEALAFYSRVKTAAIRTS
ncbi:aldehyde dehydrogenase [Protaetiibacter sp. SSC-01]|uniref:aldehyde dehydrogenase family protein n=1 Tax=Protaetiibacter sp. SSC-01 TaxID=2759943 RepID=UPI001656FCD0|nr:aldehyde dehydrogenase family protein [Protaetiibacter sp. SSC-01]QNO38310.1 aldehyde dehydrogenase [Protaetiibacter sp. SSC-01]